MLEMTIVGSTSQRSKTTSDLQSDNLSHIAQLYEEKYLSKDVSQISTQVHTSTQVVSQTSTQVTTKVELKSTTRLWELAKYRIGYCVYWRRIVTSFTNWLKANVFRSLTVQLKTRLAEGEHIAFCAGVFIFSNSSENLLAML